MEFSLASSCGPDSWDDVLMSVILGLLVGGPLLLLWLRRSPRNARDVLQAAPALPVSSRRRLLDVAGWVLPTAALLILPMAGTAAIYAAMFFGWPTDDTYGLLVIGAPVADPSWSWIAAASMAASACLIRWLRSSSSRDVLRVRTQA